MDRNNEELKRDEIGRLSSADKVQGTPVHNPSGESLGTIENIMIDKPSGRVAYAVLAFGGILGMGKDRRTLPWDVLEYDTAEALTSSPWTPTFSKTGRPMTRRTPTGTIPLGARRWIAITT